MTAFEIYLNDRKKCTVGLAEAGVVSSVMTWVNSKPKNEHLDFRVGGLVSRSGTHIDWLHRRLKNGDEVRIVVVEKAKVDRPKQTRTESEAMRTKRKKSYVEKLAAEFGWKITR